MIAIEFIHEYDLEQEKLQLALRVVASLPRDVLPKP
jgi:hypothetical protein